MGKIETAARTIADARKNQETLYGLPETSAPDGLEEGYAIQQAFIEEWEDDVAGWKVGATSPQSMAMFDTDEPFYGPIFSRDLLKSPARLDPAPFHIFGVESEIAFVFARDMPAQATPRSREEVLDFLSEARIAMEFVSPRLDKPGGYGIAQLIADGAGNGAVVLGPRISGWRDLDLSTVAARMVIDGEEISAGTGADVLGDPVESLIWLSSRAGGHGIEIKAGDAVITGTMTGLQMAAPGVEAVADFGNLGEVKLALR